MPKSFYITTPIYYANGELHLGHMYTNLISDVLANYQRLQGCKVRLLTGADEHGQKIKEAALKNQTSPQAYVDGLCLSFKNLLTQMQVNYDDFIRTSSARHHQGAQHFWQTLLDNGYIYLDKYVGWYSVRDETFYPESEIKDGKGPSGDAVVWLEEDSYFFKLSALQEQLLTFYEQHPDFIQPKSRYNEVISFVKTGLKDLSISRTSCDWGIPVPQADQHVMYVWLDALTNYINALGYPQSESALFQEFWQQATKVHVLGKDILRFHAIYWPAFLLAAQLPVPDRLLVHGWWTNNQEKMSKSLGNIVKPLELIEKFGLDNVRYFLLKGVTLGADGDFSEQRLIDIVNSDLANNIGNLVQRTVKLSYKNCQKTLPALNLNITEYTQNTILAEMLAAFANYQTEMQNLRPDRAIEQIQGLARQANIYIDQQAPWNLKTEPQKQQLILAIILELIRHLGIMLLPIVPNASQKIFMTLGQAQQLPGFAYRCQASCTIAEPEIIFNKI